ncbi:DUF2779 domain-containing protein [Patescibacteria group bacterium]
MIISKSDYIKYYQCAKALWLYKNRKDYIPEDYEESRAGIIANGEAIEKQAYKLFPEGVWASAEGFREGIDQTARLVMDKTPVIFQASFWASDLYCRSDIIKHNPGGNTWDLYEIKSATSIKKEYLPDLAFQKVVLETAGLKVNKIRIIYVNRDYVRQGEIDPEKFLVMEDVTGIINQKISKVHFDIEDMSGLIKQKREPKVRIIKQCQDPYPCMFIDYCWQDIPKHSIYNVYFNTETIKKLLADKIVDLMDVPAGMIVRDKYARYHKALLEDKRHINKNEIQKELDQYQYPLYFLDYETNSPGVPMFDKYRPYQRIVFQYSLHVIEKSGGEIKHYEYLADQPGDPCLGLAKTLSKQIGKAGSVIAWYKSFEAGCNREMGERYPEYAEFFDDINGRLLDLMDFFAKGYYVDKNFYGSASLKKVMPVVAPHLTYEELNIQEGMEASNSWPILIGGKLREGEKDELRSDMLAYCKLDTFAMVEIFRILDEIACKN